MHTIDNIILINNWTNINNTQTVGERGHDDI